LAPLNVVDASLRPTVNGKPANVTVPLPASEPMVSESTASRTRAPGAFTVTAEWLPICSKNCECTVPPLITSGPGIAILPSFELQHARHHGRLAGPLRSSVPLTAMVLASGRAFAA
jgi:hypothetical protein